jgi:hypothetical protein
LKVSGAVAPENIAQNSFEALHVHHVHFFYLVAGVSGM